MQRTFDTIINGFDHDNKRQIDEYNLPTQNSDHSHINKSINGVTF